MPTAAKLIAALALALTAAAGAYVFIGQNTDIPIGARFIATNMVVGFFAGWYSLGRRPGHSNFSGALSGVRSLVFLLIGSGMVFAFYFVSQNLQQFKSKDIMSMPLAWIEKSFEYVVMSLNQDILLVIVIGRLISGVATYQASIRWR